MNKVMDYEKKYKEALENAKECLKDGSISQNSIDYIESIFPELKESEGEKIRNSLLEYLHTLPNHYAHSGVCVPEWISWLEKQGEQKPWSEEDEKKLSDILAILRGGENCHYNTHELFDWFKSIIDRVQPKQECSEEDKQLINEAAECLRKYADKVQGVNSTVYILSLADRIESLRPQKQWKPSGEQMKFLHKYAEQNNYDGTILTLLYNDLKKLKE